MSRSLIINYKPKQLTITKKQLRESKYPLTIDNFFLLRYLRKKPTPLDARYKIIEKYADKNYHHGLERYRCLELEILARDPDNVYAIEKVITFYEKNRSTFDQYLHITNPPSQEITLICTELKERLKDLRLVEYKFYQKYEKFEHWSINPKIYEVMNEVLKEENIFEKYRFKHFIGYDQIDLIENGQVKQSRSRMTTILNDYTLFNQTTHLAKYTERKFKDVTGFSNRFSHDTNDNDIEYTYYYPRCREYPTLNIKLELNRDATQVKKLLNETIDKIYELYAKDTTSQDNIEDYTEDTIIEGESIQVPQPYPLFHFEIALKGNKSLEEKFFVYDYVTYRMEEEQYNQLTEVSCKELKELIDANEETIINKLDWFEKTDLFRTLNEDTLDKYFSLKSHNKDYYARQLVVSKLKNKKRAITQQQIYEELLKLKLPIGKNGSILKSIDSIEDYYEEVKKLIDRSKKYNDFIAKK